jgi:carbon monoxide dehydrogenase subunit G
VKIEDEFEVPVPIDQVYKELNNVGEIGMCISGVKSIQVLNDDESIWKVEARAGFMARTFNIAGRITERRAPGFLSFTGVTQDASVNGIVRLTALDPSQTHCWASIEVDVTGAFKSLVDQMARGPQQKMVRETIANLKARLDPTSPTLPTPPPQTTTTAKTSLLARLRAWWQGKRSAAR